MSCAATTTSTTRRARSTSTSALGAPVPYFAHLPMILDPEGAKLSKRTGAADVMQYRDMGYLPHALLNYLVRLGWSHGDQEVFSIAQMTELFDLKDVNSKAVAPGSGQARLAQPAVPQERRSGRGREHLQWHLRSRATTSTRARRRPTSWSPCATACRR